MVSKSSDLLRVEFAHFLHCLFRDWTHSAQTHGMSKEDKGISQRIDIICIWYSLSQYSTTHCQDAHRRNWRHAWNHGKHRHSEAPLSKTSKGQSSCMLNNFFPTSSVESRRGSTSKALVLQAQHVTGQTSKGKSCRATLINVGTDYMNHSATVYRQARTTIQTCFGEL